MNVEVYSEGFTLKGVRVNVELTADQRGLVSCLFTPPVVARKTHAPASPFLREAREVLHSYFAGEVCNLQVHLAPDGTEFQRAVWHIATQIPPGEVRSYTWLAEQMGQPKATRAVASALGANPLLLFVPCHRVVRSDGTLGGFSAGIDWKVLLLAHEGAGGLVTRNRAVQAAACTGASFL